MIDLIRQPHYRFTFTNPEHDSIKRQLFAESLARVEVEVPGALVYGFTTTSRKRLRLAKSAHLWADLTDFEILVVAHGGFLVEMALAGRGLRADIDARGGAEEVYPYPTDPDDLDDMADEGAGILADLGAAGVLRGSIATNPFPWQARQIPWALSRPWNVLVWPTGTGKTAGALSSAAAVVARKHPGDILILCPGGARPTWLVQTPQYLGWPAHMVKPESAQRKKDQTLEEYVAECRAAVRPAIVVVGLENVDAHFDEIQRLLRPSVLVLDELHKCGNHSRWSPVFGQDGSVTFEPKKTDRGESTVQAYNVMKVAALPTLRYRVGLTATPLGGGRTRRLWSQWDLLSRGGFGYSYRNTFATRYCGGTEGTFGFEDDGQTNFDELRDRAAFFVHQVPYSESRRKMLPFTVEVVRIPKELQVKPERFDDAETFNQAIRRIDGETVKETNAARRLMLEGQGREAKLAEAASRKRKWVIEQVIEALRGGGKVVLFTGRIREVQEWADRIEREAARGDSRIDGLRVYRYWGGRPESEKIDILEAFRSESGPMLGVFTYQSMGESVDGLQFADLGVLAQLPYEADDFVQTRGRFDRAGGVPTRLLIPLAEGTYDERVAGLLSEKFGNVEEIFMAEEIAGLGQKLTGTEDKQAVMKGMLNAILKNL